MHLVEFTIVLVLSFKAAKTLTATTETWEMNGLQQRRPFNYISTKGQFTPRQFMWWWIRLP